MNKAVIPNKVLERFFERVYRHNRFIKILGDDPNNAPILKTLSGDLVDKSVKELEGFLGVGKVDDFFNLPEVQADFLMFTMGKDDFEAGRDRCYSCASFFCAKRDHSCMKKYALFDLFCKDYEDTGMPRIEREALSSHRCGECEFNDKVTEGFYECRFEDVNSFNCTRFKKKQ